jgi:hypothetical protein
MGLKANYGRGLVRDLQVFQELAKNEAKNTVMLVAAIFALFTSGKDAFGQLDPTFHPPYFALPDFPGRVLLLRNGKIVKISSPSARGASP